MDEAELERLRPTAQQEARTRRRFRALVRVFFIGLPVAAIVFAITGGVYLIASDHHVTHATCSLEQAPQTHYSRTVYWEVPTSCGRFTINPGNSVSPDQARQLLATLQVGQRYRLTLIGFQDWNEREITAARLTAS